MKRLAIAVLPLSLAFAAGALAASPAKAAEGYSSTPSTGLVKAAKSVREHDLRAAQEQLKKDGDYKGPVDGKNGPKTIAAIEKFQAENGLKKTGWLDQKTWSLLDQQHLAASAGTSMHGAK
jgi:peptidoglycan hydrolase-like protein with peptidoglycan-binding domain